FSTLDGRPASALLLSAAESMGLASSMASRGFTLPSTGQLDCNGDAHSASWRPASPLRTHGSVLEAVLLAERAGVIVVDLRREEFQHGQHFSQCSWTKKLFILERNNGVR